MSRGPTLFELEDSATETPATAAQPPEDGPPTGAAMRATLSLGRRRMTWLGRLGWGAALALLGMALSIAAWDFVTGLIARNPSLGWVAGGLLALVGVACLGVALREWMGFRRLARLDDLRQQADRARNDGNRNTALRLMARLSALYANRPEMRWHRDRLAELAPDQPDAEGLLHLSETTLLVPLDQAARAEVEAAARQVALLTAMLPMALVDVVAALAINLRMIRRIAEIYGGRAGALGSIRLLRGVVAHLLATGAVAVGEDMLGSVASGGVVSKLSRRFGEGLVNGALTARLGIAAMSICRPLPFVAAQKPRTSNIVSRAISGLFDRG
ncbi:MAG: putative membrane protein [Roseibaca calidilacus]|uniref:Membrane protein n=1 Tax=Roseibaca calidilacus TaxID=1666912 RepID=A0A0P7YJ68_9RHOB|nr:TIGR01620 family protein [Roseibaca calidilacus]KPP90741.1 MAG: putative membrane protein [Roseibaca calidilacus]CUX83482.1 putative membrane protein [Roseibaca calidilacus]